MAETSVQVKKAAPAQSAAPDVWRTFRSEMDRVFDRFSNNFGFPAMRRMFDLEPFWRQEGSFDFAAPAIDVTESENAYKLTAELPGISEKDVEVSVTGDALVLKGEKRQEREEKEKNRYLSERAYGAFQRVLPIPDGVDADGIAAEFSKGVLTVTLPKSKEAQTRQKKIEIKSA
jgi:HSP20 family protein